MTRSKQIMTRNLTTLLRGGGSPLTFCENGFDQQTRTRDQTNEGFPNRTAPGLPRTYLVNL